MLLVLAVAAVAAAVVVLVSGGGRPRLRLPGSHKLAHSSDPFAYIPSRAADFAARATAGSATVLFVKSPGGVLATAARVARWRPLVNAAARGTGIDPSMLEAIVFLESAGNPDALAGSDAADAAGLTQILAQTGQALLGMQIELGRSRLLTDRIDAAFAVGDTQLVAKLQRQRARIDARFVPRKALAATVRYLQLAKHRFGSLGLAVVSYHMGIGNLLNVLKAYDGGRRVPYVQLFFDTSPDHNGAAYKLLSSLGDDSSLYFWRVLGALQIMRLYRTDRPALRRLAALETATGSTADVLHPPASTPTFNSEAALRAAFASRKLVPLPPNPARLGLAYARSMRVRGLRSPALDLLAQLAVRVRTISGSKAPLVVARTVTVGRSGWSFEIERRYANHDQAVAFQAMLDRLQALNLIAWTRGGRTIAVTVASNASQALIDGP
jgi:hypothetical protein